MLIPVAKSYASHLHNLINGEEVRSNYATHYFVPLTLLSCGEVLTDIRENIYAHQSKIYDDVVSIWRKEILCGILIRLTT